VGGTGIEKKIEAGEIRERERERKRMTEREREK